MISAETANSLLEAFRNHARFVQVHVGPPGDGSLNRAQEFRRPRIRWNAPRDGSLVSGLVRWERVPADERWTHFSLWDDDRRFVADGHLEVITVRRGDDVDLEFVHVAVTAPS